MYDVIYIDAHGARRRWRSSSTTARTREVARQAAAERGAGRMVLPGSTQACRNCVCVVPVPPAEAA